LTGNRVKFLQTSDFNGGTSPGQSDYLYFSSPESYILVSLLSGENFISGNNGEIVNKSLYVPQCWRVRLRIILKDNYYIPPGYYKSNAINLHGFLSVGIYPGVIDLINYNIDGKVVGYATQRDPSCVATHDPLILSRPAYEFANCKTPIRRGLVSWPGLQGSVKYTLQEKQGSTWRTLSSGFNTSYSYDKTGGKYRLRVRASAESINGPWESFTAYVPECLYGGGIEPSY